MLVYRSAGSGYWTTALIPLALFLHEESERSNILLALVVINSLLLSGFHLLSTDGTLRTYLQTLKPANIALSTIAVLYSFAISGEPTPYEVFTFVSLNFAFPYVFYTLIRFFPRSFTFGEGIIITQAFIFSFWSAVTYLPFPPTDITKASEAEIIFIFVQGGFLTVMLASRILVMTKKPWVFEFTHEFFCIWAKCSLLGLFVRLSTEDLQFLSSWVANFFFVSSKRTTLMVYCLTLIALAFGVVAWKHYTYNSVTTAYRKYFHFLIVAVYLPGILSDANMLHICSVAVLYIMIFIEVIRFLNLNILKMLPLGEWIDSKVGIFRDHQDEGRLIVTPLYLLAGCSLPIWLVGLKYQNSELPSATLAAQLSGILSIGIGDTFASIGGTMFGSTRWRGSAKTLEGTLCSIASQIIFAFALVFSGMCSMNISAIFLLFIAIVINALVEGLTDQIDNLVLPLVVFDVVLGANYILKLFV